MQFRNWPIIMDPYPSHVSDAWELEESGLDCSSMELYDPVEHYHTIRQPSMKHSSKITNSSVVNMRVAIAGTGGLARNIAHAIYEGSGHQMLLLSRAPKPDLAAQGYQVMVVDYNDPQSLQFALTGIDVVISTVPGFAQINLIDAAVIAGVKRFAPAEFEGLPRYRANGLDTLDRGKATVLEHLRCYRPRLESTVFVCGVLYERFAPGGLHAQNIGLSAGIGLEGDYMMNLRYMSARIPFNDNVNHHVSICLTSARDLGRFIAKALDLELWPDEMTMCGERMTTYTLLRMMEQVRGRRFHPNINYYSPGMLEAETQKARDAHDAPELWRLLELQATALGRYDFGPPDLNSIFSDVMPIRFQDWLARAWAGQ